MEKWKIRPALSQDRLLIAQSNSAAINAIKAITKSIATTTSTRVVLSWT